MKAMTESQQARARRRPFWEWRKSKPGLHVRLDEMLEIAYEAGRAQGRAEATVAALTLDTAYARSQEPRPDA